MLDIPALDEITPVDVFGEAGADAILAKIETAAKAVEIDISTEAGRKECASLAYKIAKLKNGIDEIGKGVAAEWKAKASKVDAARRVVWTKLEKLQTDIRKPLTDFETTEQARVQDHEQRIALISTLHTFEGLQPTAQDIQNRLSAISDHMQRDWQEFGKRATEVADATRDNLQKQLAARQKYDADQAELERLRKQQEERDRADREAKIKADAEATAAKRAEQEIAAAKAREEAAIKAAQDAKDKAERDAKEAVAKAERDAKEAAARAEREAKEAAEKAEEKSKPQSRQNAPELQKPRQMRKRRRRNARPITNIRPELTARHSPLFQSPPALPRTQPNQLSKPSRAGRFHT